MHLWPSLKLRNSFKGINNNSHKRFQRERSSSNQQKLLLLDRDKESDTESSCSWFVVVCRDLAMVLSCCFCCGACIDEEEN